jgi:DNA (cytosine-5)-methyltransferase 1
VVDTAGERWREGRSASTVADGRSAPAIRSVGVGDANGTGLEDRLSEVESTAQPAAWPPGPADGERWKAILAVRPNLAPAVERDVLRAADRMAARVDRLRGVGNGVVPLVAA